MGVVAVLHDLVRLDGLVQDVAEISSLWGREVMLEGTREKEEGKRRRLGALSTRTNKEWQKGNEKDMFSVRERKRERV